MRPGVSLWMALRVLALGALRGRCPSCRTRSMFRGLYSLRERCPNCGTRYEVESGAWLGAAAIGYVLAALIAVALLVVELRTHVLADAGVDPAWGIAVAGLLAVLLTYRIAKGLWVALLWLFGFTEDAPQPPN